MVASVAFGALSETKKLEVINLSFVLKNVVNMDDV